MYLVYGERLKLWREMIRNRWKRIKLVKTDSCRGRIYGQIYGRKRLTWNGTYDNNRVTND